MQSELGHLFRRQKEIMQPPQLVHQTAQGGTIHTYHLTGGKRSFQRYLGCYLGKCKFCNNIEEASEYLDELE